MKTEQIILLFAVAVIALGVGFAISFFLKRRTESQTANAGETAVKLLEDAKRESETIIREAAIQAKEEFEKETVEKKRDLQSLEKRVQQKEENLDKKVNLFDQREIEFSKREQGFAS